MKVKLLLTSAALAIMLTLLQPGENLVAPTNGWKWLSFFLSGLIIGAYVSSVRNTTARRILYGFVVSFVIGLFSLLIEALIFSVITPMEFAQGLVWGSIPFVVISIAMAFSLRAPEQHPESDLNCTFSGWTKRILMSILLYIVCYLSAGMILQATYPPLMDFYAGKIPPFGLIILAQVFRALIFTAVAVLIVRTTALTRLQTAVLIGVVFSVLGGIAPLLSPNELMPAHIRIAHGFEVGISNFVYGFLLARLIGSSKGRSHPAIPNR